MSDVTLSRGPIFDSGGVTITREIANIRGTSYPINGIGSVRVAEPRRGNWIMLGIALLCGAFAAGSLGFVIIIGAIFAFAQAYRLPHILVIHTASGDRSALEGKRDDMLAIKQAIEMAVTMRG